ncbi:MAG TPA: hypothetical protein VFZ11_13225 [Gemmatimonadaceae bacterium]
MLRFLRRWSHRELLGSWVAYWIGLIAVVAAPAFLEWWRLQRTGAHGSVSVTVDAGAVEMALWIAGPPLLVFVLWLLARPRTRARAAPREPAAPSAALPGAEPLDEAALRDLEHRARGARDPDRR